MFQFVVLDAGGTLSLSNSLSEATALYLAQSQTLMSTCAAECMRQHLTDCMDFIGDLHTLTKVKVRRKCPGFVTCLKNLVSLYSDECSSVCHL